MKKMAPQQTSVLSRNYDRWQTPLDPIWMRLSIVHTVLDISFDSNFETVI